MATALTKTTKNAAMDAQQAEWMAEDDMRTLMRAEEIKRDPKRYARAKATAKKKLAEMQAVAGSTK